MSFRFLIVHGPALLKPVALNSGINKDLCHSQRCQSLGSSRNPSSLRGGSNDCVTSLRTFA